MKIRKDLSADGLFRFTRNQFGKIKDERGSRAIISVGDALMSVFAVFSLKFPSLFSFDRIGERQNVKRVYGVKEIPSDTQMRTIVDEVEPRKIRAIFKRLFALIQRGKGLEPFSYLGGYLCSIDGTGYFTSKEVHCESCLENHHKDRTVTYHHQMLSSVVVHPDLKEVVPIGAEPIVKQDGDNKNDCERNAMKRLVADLRREHPHLNLILTADGLSSNGPLIKQVKKLRMHYIFSCKKSDHPYLFKLLETDSLNRVTEFEIVKDKVRHQFRFANDVLLNQAHLDLSVNFLEYWQHIEGKRTLHFSWVTDLTITRNNVMELMRGGRARWKIENETYNTLKNQGYNFEHNFGHGYKNLSVNFALIMFLVFAVDQAQQICCPVFKRALNQLQVRMDLWERIRAIFFLMEVHSYIQVLTLIYERPPNSGFLLALDTG